MEQRLKQRLVGAIVLVSLAVVFVPILFDSPRELNEGYSAAPIAGIPERPQVEADAPARITLEAPETPRLDAEVEREHGRQGAGTAAADRGASSDRGASPDASASSSASSDASDASDASAAAPAATGPSASARPSASSSAGAAPAAAAPDDASGSKQAATDASAAASGGWLVQLGSFRESENARALRKSLEARGYTAFVEAGPSAQGEVFRVFVGPVPRREQAEDSAAKLRSEMALKGIVVPRSGG